MEPGCGQESVRPVASLAAVSVNDEAAMALALAEGERGRLTAPPNPWVGCVLVRDGEIVGRGFHRKAGEPHAEPLALAEAGERARAPPPSSPSNRARTRAARPPAPRR